MIWLTWRLQRLESTIAAGILVLLTAIVIPTGLSMINAYHHLGVARCLPSQSARCALVVQSFLDQFPAVTSLAGWFNLLPLLLGLALAAPFMLEIEQGTYRVAWTQSVTRQRWLSCRLGFVVVSAVLAGVLFSALMSWWRIPLDHIEGNFVPNEAFDFEGFAPVAYTVFAACLCVAAAVLTRRTVVSIIISVAGFLAVRLCVQSFWRPHYLTPLKVVARMPQNPFDKIGRTDWTLTQGFTTPSGRAVAGSHVFSTCRPKTHPNCFSTHHFLSFVLYQPADRFWAFQEIEAGIFLALSIVLTAGAVWWFRWKLV
jgi:hypothetical protein